MNVDQMASRHAQQAMDAQNRRRLWHGKGKIIHSKNGKQTDVSNYNFGQYKQMYKKMFGGGGSSGDSSGGGDSGSSGGSSGGGGGSSSNRVTQLLRHVANNAVGQFQRARANKQSQLEGMNKKDLVKLLSQALSRQGKGGH